MWGQNGDNGWQLRGTARQVATFVAAVFAAAAVVVAAIDRSVESSWDSVLLQNWSLLPHALATAGLFYIVGAHKSRTFWSLGTLFGLIFIEEAFHVLNSLAGEQSRVARWVSRGTGLSWNVAGWVVLYGAVAIVGFAFLAFAYWQASTAERKVVRNLAVLLAIGGLFGGPISSLAALEDPRRLTFVEEFGEAIAYAVMAGYVAGLVAAVYTRRSRDSSASDHPSFARRVRP